MSFTPSDAAVRDEIRTALGENLCVEAGAGTGKTTSLVGRIVEILASGRADVDSLAVITFTEKAAAELSTRVREQLEDAALTEPDPRRRERIERAARGLYRARLETIHTFAANLLRERPVEAGIDPGFTILSDLESELSFDDAYSAWVDELMDGDHPEVERSLNLGFGLDEIRETAELLHGHRYLLPLRRFAVPDPDADELGRWLERHDTELRQIAGRCQKEEDKGLAQLERLFRFAERLRAEGTTSQARERLAAMAAPSLTPGRGAQGSWADPEDCKRMKSLVGELRDLSFRLRDELRAVALLGVLPPVERFVADYEAARRSDGVADFDDLLIWARDLLRDRLDVRRYFQRRFRCLLIDEFQDTDPIQVEIAVYIASDGDEGDDWRALRVAPGKLFVVGDPKQSIYRFRRADIAIYDEVKRGALAGGLRNLVQNFRSSPEVIAWVNRVFDSLFVEVPGQQPANVALEPQPESVELGRPPVVVVRGGGEELNAEGVRAAEPRAVASVLRGAVVDERWPVRDRVTGEQRPATWRDIAVLMPTRSGLEAYEEAFALAGIPYRHEGSRDYFRRQEVRDLIAILRAIDDPTDRFSVVGALRSSAFGCSDQDLVIHLGTGGRWDYRSDARGDSAAVGDAFDMLRELHRLRSRTSLGELVHAVLERTRLVEFALTLPDGPQAAANLLAIVDQARAFSSAGGGGLRAFARRLVQNTEIEAAEVDAGIAEETDDVVRLMTIHGAKGLEFPIVVLANLASEGSKQREPVPDEPASLLHFRVGSRGAGRSGHYATPGYDDRWEAEKAALAAERIRLLYVAATRARDHLVVPCFEGKRKPGPTLEALMPHLPEADGHEVAVDGMWLLDADELPEAPEDERVPREVMDTEVEEATEEREAWLDDHRELLRAAGREPPFVIASSVERATRPLAAEASHSGATLLVSDGPPLPVGDALHLVMERVSLPEANDFDEVVDAVCAEAGLAERRHEVADMARRCLESPVVKRAIASGTYQREVPFTVEHDGGFALGRVDLVYRVGDELVVVDYKTDVVEAATAETHAREHHAGQAEVYAVAIARATGTKVGRIVFVFARSGVDVALESPTTIE